MAKKTKPAPKGNGKLNKLTPRQEQFCREYVIDLNATRAARASGYRQPNVAGAQNIAKDSIKARLTELKKEGIGHIRDEETMALNADAVLEEVRRMAAFRPEDFATVDESTGKVKYVITKDNLHRLKGIAGLRVRECPPIKVIEAGVEIEREVLEVEFKTEKAKALEMLMKHLGIIQEKVEVAGMNELVAALHKGRERVAKLREEREKAKDAAR